jgi:uncharacterized protein
VGTSTGSLVAAGAALGLSGAELVDGFQKFGPDIFASSRKRKRPQVVGVQQAKQLSVPFLISLTVDQLGVDLSGVRKAPYKHERLEDAIVKMLGKENAETRMSEIDAPLALVSVSYSHARPVIFRTRGLDPANPSEIRLKDALIASASAPTYFPPMKVEFKSSNEYFIDGGIVANTPDIVGVTEAIGRLYCDAVDVYMLSIGTAGANQAGGPKDPGNPSGFDWLHKFKLIAKLIYSQEALAQQVAQTLLDHRYQRIDFSPPSAFEQHVTSMDDVSPMATSSLMLLADRAWDDAVDRLRDAGHLR